MRGVATVMPPSAIARRLDRLRADSDPSIAEAKRYAKQGDHHSALEVLVAAGYAEAGHLLSHRRWVARQPTNNSIEALV